MKFRLTIGENGTPWGKQSILDEGEAENAIEYLRSLIKRECPDARYTAKCKEIRELLNNCWVDAGPGTINIAVQSLKF